MVASLKVGRGTWDAGLWGRGDVGTWGRGDVGLGDLGTWGRGDVGTWGRGDAGTWGREDFGTRRRTGIRGRDKQIAPDFCAELVKYFVRPVADDFQRPWFLLAYFTERALLAENE